MAQKIWYKTQPDGKRVGYMDPVEFETILAGIYGDRGWIRKFADDFAFSQPSVYRWVRGEVPIPKHIALAVLMMTKLGGPAALPQVDAPWLEDIKA